MRIKIFWIALIVLILNVVSLHAQTCSGPGCPCGGSDDDGTCTPLDTWVIILASAVFIFSVKYLHNKQKNINTIR